MNNYGFIFFLNNSFPHNYFVIIIDIDELVVIYIYIYIGGDPDCVNIGGIIGSQSITRINDPSSSSSSSINSTVPYLTVEQPQPDFHDKILILSYLLQFLQFIIHKQTGILLAATLPNKLS